jgi:general secretion pathway protein N
MTRRRIIVYAVLGCIVYAIALIATAPASWISHTVDRASSHRVALRAPAGSIWAGSGRLYAIERSGPPLELGELRWRAAWYRIFTGKLATDLRFGDASRSMHIEASPFGVTIRGLDIALPGRVLASFAPGLGAMGPQGTLRIRSESLSLAADSVLGLAEVEWRQIRLTRAPELDLGSHVARLRGGGSNVDIELGTLEGPLQLSGKGNWDRSAGLTMAGAAEHGAQPSPALSGFLRTVCPEYRNNRCAFRFKL